MRKNQAEWPQTTRPDLSFEHDLWNAGVTRIAGIDEVGRGALAGPVAAAALVLPPESAILEQLAGVRDSKQLTPQQRAYWAEHLRQAATTWGVGYASQVEIDTQGIVPATRLAMQRAIESLAQVPQHLLLDFMFLPDCPLPQTALVKGDARSLSIAGASILAKTARDALMKNLEGDYPGYGFASHKGYCTPRHVQAIQRLGPCPLHRLTFTPLKDLLD
jgi:ribonuclease HII